MADFKLDDMLLEAAGWPKEDDGWSHTSPSKRRRASSMSSDDRNDSSPNNDDEDDNNEFDKRGGGRGGEVMRDRRCFSRNGHDSTIHFVTLDRLHVLNP